MDLNDIRCAHTCRNACQLLRDALRQEKTLLQFYERIRNECDYPYVSEFVQQLIGEKSSSILNIVQKLNELEARSQILDDVSSSFDDNR